MKRLELVNIVIHDYEGHGNIVTIEHENPLLNAIAAMMSKILQEIVPFIEPMPGEELDATLEKRKALNENDRLLSDLDSPYQCIDIVFNGTNLMMGAHHAADPLVGEIKKKMEEVFG